MTPPSASIDHVRNTVEAHANGAARPDPLREMLERRKADIASALPKHISPERMLRVALTCIRTTPKLVKAAEDSPASLIAAIVMASQLGLEPGGWMGQCYILPFDNRRTGKTEAQFIVGYKGIIDLARRSGRIVSIEAREVCQGDEFEYEYGLADRLVHKPKIDGDRGPAYAYYGVAKFTDGGHYFLVMSKSDIEAHRRRSRAKDNGPWVTDYDAMARKTVIRAMAPYLPVSVELARAFDADEQAMTGRHIEPDMAEEPDTFVIDVPPVDDEPDDDEDRQRFLEAIDTLISPFDSDTRVRVIAEIENAVGPPEDVARSERRGAYARIEQIVDAARSSKPAAPTEAQQPADPGAEPLTGRDLTAQRKLLTAKADQAQLNDAQMQAIVRYVTRDDERCMAADLATMAEFGRAQTIAEEAGEGKWVFVDQGGRSVLYLKGHEPTETGE